MLFFEGASARAAIASSVDSRKQGLSGGGLAEFESRCLPVTTSTHTMSKRIIIARPTAKHQIIGLEGVSESRRQ